MGNFKLVTDYKLCGDQPQAVEKLSQSILAGNKYQTLLGVTGSGKTFVMANVINRVKKPTLIISPNKTLAAQLYSEIKEFFPHNAVEYFVSYYDYYQPEAYIPQTDTYIDKDSSINENIDKLRLAATTSLVSRQDVIIVASVSCIYNLGSPSDYRNCLVFLEKGQEIGRDEVLKQLIDIHYVRNDIDFHRGTIRARGDVIEIVPAYMTNAWRIEFFGDVVEKIKEIEVVSGKIINEVDKVGIYPAKHFVTTEDKIRTAVRSIKRELKQRLDELHSQDKLLEAQRLESRTKFDIDMLSEIGYCHGVENYSRHLSSRKPGSRPDTLIDYFPNNFLVIIDESHITVPQIRGMYEGDKSRKETLVEYGFRLPSALDNRPLKFKEFDSIVNQIIFVSATPSDYEISVSQGQIVEQIIRPTGVIDPAITIRPTKNQVDDLIEEIKKRAKKKERVLVTTLTKRMSEDLSSYLQEMGIKVRYLHSEIDTIERVNILKELRLGEFDCLVGINLLREGLDLPEVSLVAVLDADKEGFLRSQTSLIQVGGRAARNINGQVIMYADIITSSMRNAINETNRRRKIQMQYNKENNITPKNITTMIKEGIETFYQAEEFAVEQTGEDFADYEAHMIISELEKDMELAARNLEFEKAAKIRDKIIRLQAADNKLQDA